MSGNFKASVFYFFVLGSFFLPCSSEIENKLYISHEEHLRRHKILESFLPQSKQDGVDWIEPYNVLGSHHRYDHELISDDHIPLQKKLLLTATVGESTNVPYLSDETALNLDYKVENKPLVHFNYPSQYNVENSVVFNSKDRTNMNPIQNLKTNTCVNKQVVLENDLKILFGMTLIKEMCSISKSHSSLEKSSINRHENRPSLSGIKTNTSQNSKPNRTTLESHTFQDEFDKLTPRQKILHSYLSKEDNSHWIDVHDFGTKPFGSKTSDPLNLEDASGKQIPLFSQNCVTSKLFPRRLVKKLLEKLKSVDGKLVYISVTPNFLMELEKFSDESFDIDSAEKMFNHLMSSIIIYVDYNWATYIPNKLQLLLKYYNISMFDLFYAAVVIVMFYMFFTKRASLMHFVLLFIFGGFIYALHTMIDNNTQKMYQKRMAKKQHILSGISPSYCTTLITENSGIIDHIREYFRYYSYNEYCKVYYEALMVNPEHEVNFVHSVVDILSNTVLLMLHNLFEVLNTCVKSGFHDTTWLQKFFISTVFCFLMLLIFRYKIKLPGVTLEPVTRGSQVEDVRYPEKNAIKTECINFLNTLDLKGIKHTAVNSTEVLPVEHLEGKCNASHPNEQHNQGQVSSLLAKVDQEIQVSSDEIIHIEKSNCIKKQHCYNITRKKIVCTKEVQTSIGKNDISDLRDESPVTEGMQDKGEQICLLSSRINPVPSKERTQLLDVNIEM